jgi:predicted aldo/keto reductase-like oxidoreductase
MEPVLGGRLASPPPVIRKEFDQSPRYSPAEWALQWIWNQPEVTTVLSGMSNLAQLDENLAAADRSAPNSFSPNDHALIERVTKAFRGAMPVPCTQCQYCMPCPHGIDIPTNFKVFNDFSAYQDHGYARALYARFLGESARSSACIACGECEERCPQKIPIANQMKKVTAALAP